MPHVTEIAIKDGEDKEYKITVWEKINRVHMTIPLDEFKQFLKGGTESGVLERAFRETEILPPKT